MIDHNIRNLIAASSCALLLGGCATYGASRPAYSYFAVPCSTPGSIPATPIADPSVPPANPPVTPPSAVVSPTGVSPSLQCIVAVDSRYRYGSNYGGYAPYGYYGSPYFGGIGIGLGGYWGGGHNSGHFGGYAGGHSGGHRGHH